MNQEHFYKTVKQLVDSFKVDAETYHLMTSYSLIRKTHIRGTENNLQIHVLIFQR